VKRKAFTDQTNSACTRLWNEDFRRRVYARFSSGQAAAETIKLFWPNWTAIRGSEQLFILINLPAPPGHFPRAIATARPYVGKISDEWCEPDIPAISKSLSNRAEAFGVTVDEMINCQSSPNAAP